MPIKINKVDWGSAFFRKINRNAFPTSSYIHRRAVFDLRQSSLIKPNQVILCVPRIPKAALPSSRLEAMLDGS
jgi:hypothetical protein